MRILDKYILKKALFSYLAVLFVFIGLYFIIDMFSHISDFVRTKIPLTVLLKYYLYMTPLVFLRVSPFSILISGLYTFGELNKNNEIVTMRASGISIARISFPLVFLSLIVSIAALLLQEKILIRTQKKAEDINIQFIKGNSYLPPEEQNLAFSSGDKIFFVRKFIPKEARLEDATIFQENNQGIITRKITSRRIVFKGTAWWGEGVMSYALTQKGNIEGLPAYWENKKIKLSERPRDLIYKKSIFAEFKSLKNLKKEISRLKKIKSRGLLNNLAVEYHRKIAMPFSHCFLIIGIIPFALEVKKRKVALSSLGKGFIFGFIYYSMDSFSIALGKSGLILAAPSAWLTPLFFLAIGLTGLFIIR